MNLKSLGLALLAALSLLATVGTASASALPTTLCKSNKQLPYCLTEDQHAKTGTAIKASTSEIAFNTSIVNVRCQSSFEGTTAGAEGDYLHLSPVAWTISSCNTFGNSPCTATNEGEGALGGIKWRTYWQADLEFELLSWRITCGETLDCKYLAPKVLIEGSIKADAVPLTKTGGLACPTTSTLSGTLAPSAPEAQLMVAIDSEPPATEVTSLCKRLEGYCAPVNRYPKGTVLLGNSTDATVDFPSNYGFGDAVCKKSKIEAKTTAEYGQPLGIEFITMVLDDCTAGGGSGPACFNESREVFGDSVLRANGDGWWDIGGTWFSLRCEGIESCKYTFNEKPVFIIEHGSPGTIRVDDWLGVSGGGWCPTGAKLKANFVLSQPSGTIWFMDAAR